MVEMKKIARTAVVLLALCFISTQCADSTTECTTGAGCFPYGPVPDNVKRTDLPYYCCPQKNMTSNSKLLPDKSINCSCVLDLNLESKTAALAWRFNGQSRMCSREKDCDGKFGLLTINYRFKYCCYKADDRLVVENETTTAFDADKEEFIVCRCWDLSLPTPDPKAYVVPPVPSVNSTGEMCSYDEGCRESPSAKCGRAGQYVAFCCYGSRGLVTQNEANSLTRCTCTNDVYGGQCEARPIAINRATVSCQTNCTNRADEETCTDSVQGTRCCPYNMAVVASQSKGNFTSCACKTQVQRNCGAPFSSFATRVSARFSDLVSLMLAAFVVGQFGHDGFISLPSLSFFWK